MADACVVAPVAVRVPRVRRVHEDKQNQCCGRGPAFAAGRDGPGESGKVAGVVDAMDGGKSAAVPLDLINGGGAEI
jgi:hypothetical protein